MDAYYEKILDSIALMPQEKLFGIVLATKLHKYDIKNLLLLISWALKTGKSQKIGSFWVSMDIFVHNYVFPRLQIIKNKYVGLYT